MAVAQLSPARPHVLVLASWPHGFCPVHYGCGWFACNRWCLSSRMEYAQLAADFEQYWLGLYGCGSVTLKALM